jgi:glutathione synthase/RimK-type ligase-like ATP-grasp enzyme
MKNCAFLSMDNLEDFVCYDHLLVTPFEHRGWSVTEVSWSNDQIDWDQFDAVLIRSPWDYQKDPEAFLKVLEQIEASDAILENDLELVKWNIDKSYLRDLEQQDVEIVPSLWFNHFSNDIYPSAFDNLNVDEIVIKPTISAGADNTFRIRHSSYSDFREELKSVFDNRPFLVQPFMEKITEEGEFSVFFFGDSYSHTILKTPKAQDFRVQEEHGGILKKVEPENHLLDTAQAMRDMIQPEPLYTRADYVRTAQNTFALMELELIEPSLYFNMDEKSPARFAKVFDQWMKNRIPQTA